MFGSLLSIVLLFTKVKPCKKRRVSAFFIIVFHWILMYFNFKVAFFKVRKARNFVKNYFLFRRRTNLSKIEIFELQKIHHYKGTLAQYIFFPSFTRSASRTEQENNEIVIILALFSCFFNLSHHDQKFPEKLCHLLSYWPT